MVRVEDGPLLRGRGRYVDDLDIPGALHVVFLRSPVAHGRLKGIDAGAAKAVPGVHAVLTFADLRPLLTGDRIPQSLPSGAIRFHVDPIVLAKDEVTYVGEPVAMVVADSRRLAEDALALIQLDIEELPAVTDPVAGLAPGAPKARMDCPDNLVARQAIDYGDIDGAFAKRGASLQGAVPAAQGRRPFDRDARHRGAARSGRRHLDDLRQHAIAASREANSRRGARHRRAAHPRGGAGLRRRLRAEGRVPSRGAGAAGGGPAAAKAAEVDGGPPREFRRRGRRARPGLGHGDGDRRGGPDARLARQALPRPRRLHALRRGARVQRRHQRDRALCAAGVPPGHQLVPDQLRAVRADARRGAAAGHVRDGAAARRGRREARHRARRGAAAQHDPAGADAVCDADQAARRLDHDLRQRRLSGVPAPRARSRRLGGFPGAAGGGTESRAAISGSASPTMSRRPGAGRSRAQRFASAHRARSS